MPLFLGCQCWASLNDKIPFPATRCRPDLLCMCWSVLFFKPWRNVSLTCLKFFLLTRIKLCCKPCFSGAVPQNYLRGCLLGYGPHFGSVLCSLETGLLIISIYIAWCSWQDIRKTHVGSPGVYFSPPSLWYLFIYFWLHRVLVAARGIFRCGARDSL